MKELAEDFKSIAKKDKNLFVWMAANFLLSLFYFINAIINVDASVAKSVVRYSDIKNGYDKSDWWYFFSFAIIAITLGVGHTLISARIYTKRGRDIARLFLAITMIITVIAIRFLFSISGSD